MSTDAATTSSHGHPFVFVDRVLEVEPGKRAVAVKNVTYGEAILQGHYPGRPLMPNTLVLEAMAQVAAVALQGSAASSEVRAARQITAVRRLEFHRAAGPGDQLRVTAELIELNASRAAMRVSATIGKDLVAEGELVLA